MAKWLFLLILAPWPVLAAPKEILVLLSRDLPAYQKAADAFEKHLQKNSSEKIHIQRVLFTAQNKDLKNGVPNNVSLILSIGSESSQALWDMRHLKAAVVTVFTDFYGPGASGLTSPPTKWLRCSLYASPDDTLRLIKDTFPSISNIGIIYSQNEPSSVRRLQDLEKASARVGFHIESRAVAKSAEIPTALTSLLSKVQAIVGLLDPEVYSPQSAQFIIEQCMQQGLPFVGPSPSFSKAGAVIAIYSSPADIGKQAASLALQTLRGESSLPVDPVAPIDVRWAINLHVAQMLNLRLPLFIRARAEEVYGEEN